MFLLIWHINGDDGSHTFRYGLCQLQVLAGFAFDFGPAGVVQAAQYRVVRFLGLVYAGSGIAEVHVGVVSDIRVLLQERANAQQELAEILAQSEPPWNEKTNVSII